MNTFNDFPCDVDAESHILSALLIREGEAVPKVSSIISEEDFYRPENRLLFKIITSLFYRGIAPNVLSILDELQKRGEIEKISRTYLYMISQIAPTNAYVKLHCTIVKEKANLRRLIQIAEELLENARQGMMTPAEVLVRVRESLDEIAQHVTPKNKNTLPSYFTRRFYNDVGTTQSYINRKTGFDNIDSKQFLTPGVYVIGALPAAGKTTFCWQLLEQIARQGEECIYCSYEMNQSELFSKSLARELFKYDRYAPSSAQIRRGASSPTLHKIVANFAQSNINLQVFELRDETIDDLLDMLHPFCTNKERAPVVCLDYLQIVPTSRESAKLGVDDTVRKLKKFQQDTDTTFIVISSFNRTNYLHSVSFESFKESGNIEYTADVVWALQLNVMNEIKVGTLLSEARKKVEEAKQQQPRQIRLKCLKNRQGNNYDCLFKYYSAHDTFEACQVFNSEDDIDDEFIPR